ncbi:aldehyde ferredoxin oxidoreductase family protein [Desulfobacula sp.]|uniref:aldehyde ferredoxin oxidoreductase family protein n=1 Tax=Desulfobacula sp. TaxID=2593537 RepID=UPI00261B7D98|nr:aldehyde ferredoxin oxidoreductase C-terminal domain-containing protein [Desulfobacula sp.]
MLDYGYANKILRVDLSQKSCIAEDLDSTLIKNYLGGAGFGAWYLNHENPDNTEWFDPENRLVMGVGPMSYTPIHGSGTVCFVTKGPMTNLAVSTQANGFGGAWLKSCGYDAVVIHGQAKKWSYLFISNKTVEIRDADSLIGADALDTQTMLKKELGLSKGASVYCIGPGGENKVHFSVIVGDGTHVASKGGVGAVMGAKRLKAIVICRGSFKPKIHDKPRLISLSRQLHEGATRTFLNGSRHKWGTNGTFSSLHKVGALPVKNFTTNIFPEHGKMDGRYIRERFTAIRRATCYSCAINHTFEHIVTEGPFKGFVAEEPEYEAFAAFGPQIGQTDAGAVYFLTDLADRLGLDINESGWILGWLMECSEKGILTSSDLDGINLTWGDVKAVEILLRKIAFQKGCGKLLSDGVRLAAARVGGEAVSIAICTKKGATPRGHDHRARWHELTDTCLANTSSIEATFVGVRPHLLDMPPVHDAFSPWEVPVVNARQNGWAMIEDCLGACRFNLNYPKMVVEAVNAITNDDRTLKDMLTIGRRIVNTLRVFNIRNGLTPDMEAPSPRYGSAPVDGPAKGRRILDHWDLMRKLYYKQMGWDTKTGSPLPDTLKELGIKT